MTNAGSPGKDVAALDQYLLDPKNVDWFMQRYFAWLRIKAISADPANSNFDASIAKLAEIGRECGITRTQTLSGSGLPALYMERKVDPKLPTVLVYMHNDKQPADDKDKWHIADPFDPQLKQDPHEKDLRVYGRGALDDGQALWHLFVMRAMLDVYGELPVNIKIISENEEEIGSGGFEKIVEANKDLLKADVVLVSDTEMYDRDTPTIPISLRGLVYFAVKFGGPSEPLHSGSYSGPIRDPLIVKAKVISSMIDDNNEIIIPGFKDTWQRPPLAVRNELRRLGNVESYKATAGVSAILGEDDGTFLERAMFWPTLTVHDEHNGPGKRMTIINSGAGMLFSIRLVNGQDPEQIGKMVLDHLAKMAERYPGVPIDAKVVDAGPPVSIDPGDPAAVLAKDVMSEVFGKPAVFVGEGGSIPPVAALQKHLGAGAVLLGTGLPDGRMHGPNENIPLKQLENLSRMLGRFYVRFPGIAVQPSGPELTA